MNATELVPSVSIENLLAQRDAIVERLRRAAGLILEVEDLSVAAFGDDSAAPSLTCRRANACFPGSTDELVKRVDAAAWDFLMNRSGLRTFMDAAARAQWQKDIYERKVPSLTLENVQATFKELFDSRREMFERGVIEVFRHLSWDYRTNNPRLFGKRIILRYILDTWGNAGKRTTGGPSSTGCDRLDDLIRVMTVLDGKPEPDHRQGAYAVLREHFNFQSFADGATLIGEMISIRCFHNGNGHITFLRPDLVDQLNAIVAKHHPRALPPDPGGSDA